MSLTTRTSKVAAALCTLAAPWVIGGTAHAGFTGLEAVDGIVIVDGETYHVMDIYVKFSSPEDRLVSISNTNIHLTGAAAGARFYNSPDAPNADPSPDMEGSTFAAIDTYFGFGGEQWEQSAAFAFSSNIGADLLANQSSLVSTGGWSTCSSEYPGEDLQIRVARLTLAHTNFVPGAGVNVSWSVTTDPGYCAPLVTQTGSLIHFYPVTGLPILPGDLLPGGYNYEPQYVPPPAPFGSVEGNQLLWLSPTGFVTGWHFDGFSLGGTVCLEQQAPGTYQLLGHGDSNGDGEDDLYFYDIATQSVHVWTLEGGLLAQDVLLGLSPSGGSGWQVVGIGDINGDGISDVLWQSDINSMNKVQAWIVQNTAIAESKSLGMALGFKFLALADLNGDGKSDVLWQLPNGLALAWKLNGTAAPVTKLLANAGPVPATWEFVVAGDLNGDGNSDIVWRNMVNGQVNAWLIHKFNRIAAAPIGSGMNSNWEFCGSADLDADGNVDLLWRKKSNGLVNAWRMSGVQKLSGGSVALLGTGSWIPW